MLKSTTLDDLERALRSLFQNRWDFGAHHENLNEDRLTLLAAKCSAMTLVSGNIRFMWIFEGIPWRGASNDSEVVENDNF